MASIVTIAKLLICCMLGTEARISDKMNSQQTLEQTGMGVLADNSKGGDDIQTSYSRRGDNSDMGGDVTRGNHQNTECTQKYTRGRGSISWGGTIISGYRHYNTEEGEGTQEHRSSDKYRPEGEHQGAQ